MKAVAAVRRRLHAYCPTHSVRFAVRAEDGAISCDAAPHLLANQYPYGSDGAFFELCTACDTVWPFARSTASTQCPHCATTFGQRILCKQCSVFTLSLAGTVIARCAGCGEPSGGELLHACGEVGMFSSSREECPFCEQGIVPPPLQAVDAPQTEVPTPPRPHPVGIAKFPRDIAPIADDFPASSSSSYSSPVRDSRPSRVKPAVAIIAALVVIALVVFASMDSFSRKIDRALAARRYFPPAENSVYEIYTAEATSHPASPDVAAATAKIAAQLGPETEQQLQSFYKDSRMELTWAELERRYGFLAVLVPNDAYKVRHAYAEGQRRLLEGRDYGGAFDAYHRALLLDPKFALALNGIAKLYIQESSPFRDEKEAVRYYEQAAAADPNFTWAPKNLGELAMQREQWQRAEGYMIRALATSPTRPSILSALGRISYRQNKFHTALDYYSRARQYATDPDDIRRYEAAIAQIRERLR